MCSSGVSRPGGLGKERRAHTRTAAHPCSTSFASSSMRGWRHAVAVAAILSCLLALVAAGSPAPKLISKLSSGSLLHGGRGKARPGRGGVVMAAVAPAAGGDEPLLMGPIPVILSLGSRAVQSIKGVLWGGPPAAAGGRVGSSGSSSGRGGGGFMGQQKQQQQQRSLPMAIPPAHRHQEGQQQRAA